MAFKILGKTVDRRSGAHVIYCQANLDDYLKIVGEEFGAYNIQRKRENHKAYKRLKSDIAAGALLPSITLAVKNHMVKDIVNMIDDEKVLADTLSAGNNVDILDGLQRTYIISDLKREGVVFDEKQQLLLEFWLESDISKLIYRMIVLNSGQKSMSMRHQVELLFMSLKENITNNVSGIELIKESEQKRRTQPNRYPLSSVAASYHAFVSASHEADKENLVAQKLIDEDVFDSSERELTEKFGLFLEYLNIFYKLDQLCWKKYTGFKYDSLMKELDGNEEITVEDKDKKISEYDFIKNSYVWLGSENAMLSFFSAVAQRINIKHKDRVDKALQKLIECASDEDNIDPLGMVNYNAVRLGLNPRKVNIGFATRKLINTGFKEYFRDEGEVSLSDCWLTSAE